MRVPTLTELTSLDSLNAGWARVARNRGAAGGDGVTIAAFRQTLGEALARLQRDIRGGTYRPGPLRRLDIPKDSGGTRPLAIPCVRDRVVQSAFTLLYGPLFEAAFEEESFAYRPGRSVQQAVARVSQLRRDGFGWVVDGDIERFFETVPHGPMLERLSEHVEDAGVLDLVGQWLAAAGEGCGLPQGAPVSPLLANLYLDSVDERIRGRGVRLVRYADDFLLLCRDEASAEGALARMDALLAEHGLELNADKTRVVSFAQGFRFLGYLFARSMVMPSRSEAPDRREGDVPPVPDELDPMAAEDVVETLESDGGAPGLRLLYVMEAGRALGLRNRSFCVREEDRELLAVPPGRIDRIELGPHVQVDAAALRHACAEGVPVALVDSWGRTVGRVEAPLPERYGLHKAQARHGFDPALRRDLAQRVVDGRIRNQRALIRRLDRRRRRPEARDAAERLNRCLRKLRRQGDVPYLMGVEGEAAAAYWPALGAMLEHGWTLRIRTRRPPRDPVNLVISFLSALLYRDIEALALRHGLHPGFGVLHESRDGHPACVSDLIEEFRAPLAEGLAVYLFNNRILARGAFAHRSGEPPALFPAGRDAVIHGYEQWLDREVLHRPSGDKVRWRRLIELQVLAYVAHLEEREPYQPYVMDY